MRRTASQPAPSRRSYQGLRVVVAAPDMKDLLSSFASRRSLDQHCARAFRPADENGWREAEKMTPEQMLATCSNNNNAAADENYDENENDLVASPDPRATSATPTPQQHSSSSPSSFPTYTERQFLQIRDEFQQQRNQHQQQQVFLSNNMKSFLAELGTTYATSSCAVASNTGGGRRSSRSGSRSNSRSASVQPIQHQQKQNQPLSIARNNNNANNNINDPSVAIAAAVLAAAASSSSSSTSPSTTTTTNAKPISPSTSLQNLLPEFGTNVIGSTSQTTSQHQQQQPQQPRKRYFQTDRFHHRVLALLNKVSDDEEKFSLVCQELVALPWATLREPTEQNAADFRMVITHFIEKACSESNFVRHYARLVDRIVGSMELNKIVGPAENKNQQNQQNQNETQQNEEDQHGENDKMSGGGVPLAVTFRGELLRRCQNEFYDYFQSELNRAEANWKKKSDIAGAREFLEGNDEQDQNQQQNQQNQSQPVNHNLENILDDDEEDEDDAGDNENETAAAAGKKDRKEAAKTAARKRLVGIIRFVAQFFHSGVVKPHVIATIVNTLCTPVQLVLHERYTIPITDDAQYHLSEAQCDALHVLFEQCGDVFVEQASEGQRTAEAVMRWAVWEASSHPLPRARFLMMNVRDIVAPYCVEYLSQQQQNQNQNHNNQQQQNEGQYQEYFYQEQGQDSSNQHYYHHHQTQLYQQGQHQHQQPESQAGGGAYIPPHVARRQQSQPQNNFVPHPVPTAASSLPHQQQQQRHHHDDPAIVYSQNSELQNQHFYQQNSNQQHQQQNAHKKHHGRVPFSREHLQSTMLSLVETGASSCLDALSNQHDPVYFLQHFLREILIKVRRQTERHCFAEFLSLAVENKIISLGDAHHVIYRTLEEVIEAAEWDDAPALWDNWAVLVASGTHRLVAVEDERVEHELNFDQDPLRSIERLYALEQRRRQQRGGGGDTVDDYDEIDDDVATEAGDTVASSAAAGGADEHDEEDDDDAMMLSPQPRAVVALVSSQHDHHQQTTSSSSRRQPQSASPIQVNSELGHSGCTVLLHPAWHNHVLEKLLTRCFDEEFISYNSNNSNPNRDDDDEDVMIGAATASGGGGEVDVSVARRFIEAVVRVSEQHPETLWNVPVFVWRSAGGSSSPSSARQMLPRSSQPRICCPRFRFLAVLTKFAQQQQNNQQNNNNQGFVHSVVESSACLRECSLEAQVFLALVGDARPSLSVLSRHAHLSSPVMPMAITGAVTAACIALKREQYRTVPEWLLGAVDGPLRVRREALLLYEIAASGRWIASQINYLSWGFRFISFLRTEAHAVSDDVVDTVRSSLPFADVEAMLGPNVAHVRRLQSAATRTIRQQLITQQQQQQQQNLRGH